MEAAQAARLFGWNAIWRMTGSRSAGRALMKALGSRDEDLRSLAGIFLTRGGRRAEPLLREALDRRQDLPMVLSVLGSIGDPSYEPIFRSFSQDPDPAVADAAGEGLHLLAVRDDPALRM
jgi:HEAT repeat protein